MISTDHKHGVKYRFHENEIGIWGIGCKALAQLYEQLQAAFPNQLIGYYDTKHQEEMATHGTQLLNEHVHLKLNQELTPAKIIQFFNSANWVLVNGNHEVTANMWLILDGKKEYKHQPKSIENTTLLFYNDNTLEEAKALKAAHAHLQLVQGTDFENIAKQISEKFITPELLGLVLTGGESTRMKQNKSLMVYHQQAQWLHLLELLNKCCTNTFISCTEKNFHLFNQKPVITDQLIGYGPLSGILSALLQLKNKAFLVLACDLPLINEETLNQLIKERDPSKMATAFMNHESGFLEPLITIYEPKALAIMLSMLAQGFTCPRKMLMQNDIKIVIPKQASSLKNINYPEEKEQILNMLLKKESL